MYKLHKTKDYVRDEKKYKQVIGAGRLKTMEERLSQNPTNNPSHIVKIEGFENRYRYRIGDYRIGYEVHEQEVSFLHVIPDPAAEKGGSAASQKFEGHVYFTKMGPRGDFYK